jgi:hypothetical protein
MKRLGVLTVAAALLAALVMTAPAAATGEIDMTVHATVQQFEHGLMIWRSDTGYVWALFDDGTMQGFPSASYGLLPENPQGDAPPGLIRPISGFGRVWGNDPYVRGKLGWAVLPEIGFSLRIRSFGARYYLTLRDGRVVEVMPDDSWSYFTDESEVPAITTFMVNPNPVTAGGLLVVTWEVRATDMAVIELYDADADPDQTPLQLHHYLPLSGSLTLEVPAGLARARVVLYGADRGPGYPTWLYARNVQADITVTVDNPVLSRSYTPAVYQAYEHGAMIWRADNGSVLVLWGDRQHSEWLIFPEDEYGPLPDSRYTVAPYGLVAPVRGFGRVWGNFTNVRQTLGWATGPEMPFDLVIAWDPAGLPYSILLPDGSTVFPLR